MDVLDEIKKLNTIILYKTYVTAYAYVGSRITCNPAPTDTDLDILILTPSCKNLLKALQFSTYNYKSDGSLIIDESNKNVSEFFSCKKDNINLIITENKDFFDKFIAASKIAKRFNLLEKQDRIDLFQTILYNNGDDITVMSN